MVADVPVASGEAFNEVLKYFPHEPPRILEEEKKTSEHNVGIPAILQGRGISKKQVDGITPYAATNYQGR